MSQTPPSSMTGEKIVRVAIHRLCFCKLEEFRLLFGCTDQEAIDGQQILQQYLEKKEASS